MELVLFGQDCTVALVAGCACAAAHLLLALLFSVLPDGPWRRHPGFLAHRVVALPLMVLLAAIGTPAWLHSQSTYGSPHESFESTAPTRRRRPPHAALLPCRLPLAGSGCVRSPAATVQQMPSPTTKPAKHSTAP